MAFTRQPYMKYTIMDYLKLLDWKMDLDEIAKTSYGIDTFCHFFNAIDDLLYLIADYNGIRVRDMNSFFKAKLGYAIDFERIKMKGWGQFLLKCHRVEYWLDQDKEELYAVVSEEGIMHLSESPRYKDRSFSAAARAHFPQNLLKITIVDAFLRGYLDVAEGIPLNDPRVPIQDLGVAASQALAAQQQLQKKAKNSPSKFPLQESTPTTKKNQKAISSFESGAPIDDTKITSASESLFEISRRRETSDPDKVFGNAKW